VTFKGEASCTVYRKPKIRPAVRNCSQCGSAARHRPEIAGMSPRNSHDLNGIAAIRLSHIRILDAYADMRFAHIDTHT